MNRAPTINDGTVESDCWLEMERGHWDRNGRSAVVICVEDEDEDEDEGRDWTTGWRVDRALKK